MKSLGIKVKPKMLRPLNLVVLFCLAGCMIGDQRREAEAIEKAKAACAKLLAEFPEVKFRWEAKLQYDVVYAYSVPFGRLGFPTVKFRIELEKNRCRRIEVHDVFTPQ